jgi:hypothetical protein
MDGGSMEGGSMNEGSMNGGRGNDEPSQGNAMDAGSASMP